MADDVVKITLNLLDQEGAPLKESKLKLLHTKFENAKDTSASHDICSLTNDPDKPATVHPNINIFCNQIGNILTKMDDICQEHADESIGNCCDYFVHWVYEKIIDNQYDVFNTRWLYKKVQKFIISNNSVSGKKLKCNENFLAVLDANLLKIKEALYNFLQHYDSVRNLLNGESPNRDEYCRYIKRHFSLYKQVQNVDQAKSVRAYSDEIKQFRNKFNASEIALLESKCNDASKRSTFFKEYKNILSSDEEQTTYMEQTDPEVLNKQVINYDIFYEADVYGKMEQLAESSVNSMSGITHYCNKKIRDPMENDTEIAKFCELFITYFWNLNNYNTSNSSGHEKYLEYMNYWLNHKLKDDERTPKYFIQFLNERLDERFSAFGDYNKFKEKVYNMDSNVYNEMNILYNLYLNFNKINNQTISERECSNQFKKCADIFEQGMNLYYKTKNPKFFKELTKFWSTFNNYFKSDSKACKLEDSQRLPKIKTLEEHERETSLKEALKSCDSLSSNNLDILPQSNDNYAELLKDLSADKAYTLLNANQYDKSICGKYCGKVTSSPSNHLTKLLCAKLATNLTNLSDVLKSVASPDDRCSYLTYWTYDKIASILKNRWTSAHYNNAIQEINQVIYRVNHELEKHGKNCSYNLYSNVDHWKDEKALHDYFNIHGDIINCVSTNQGGCSKYCDYINYINELYKEYVTHCCSCYSYPKVLCFDNCPKFFKCNKAYYPYDLMLKLNCRNYNPSERIDHIFKAITFDTDVLRRSQTATGFTCNGLICNPIDATILVAVTLLGIFFTLFVFYKFTPFGSWLHRRALKKKRLKQNVQTRRPRLIYSNAEPTSVRLQNRRISVPYHNSP
ncbi:VIR protein [Plasmodium vivax]|uniref:VIR protein n=1 Tax=Plasmodium vivax TaxID=5855 RepID=A0A1G4GVU6_PLAVI|nr:VIR protein [Plasmodium vivax]